MQITNPHYGGTETCQQCGRSFHIDQLDAKPQRHNGKTAEQGAQFTRLECKDCYGPGFTYGPAFQHLNKEQSNVEKPTGL